MKRTLNPTLYYPGETGRKDDFRRRLSTLISLLGLIFLFVLAQPAEASVDWPDIGGTLTTVASEGRDYLFPRIDDTTVVFHNITFNPYVVEVRYYDLHNGVDTAIPTGDSEHWLAAVDDSRIVYQHLDSAGFAIGYFDTLSTGSPTVIEQQPNSERGWPDINGQTVVWTDFGLTGTQYIPEILVYDLTSGMTTRLTNDLTTDYRGMLSPDGETVVWARCQSNNLDNCVIWQANRENGNWVLSSLTDANFHRINAVIDEQFIVYEGVDATGDHDIYWQVRGTFEEHRLALPGNQTNPAVNGGLVVFETEDAPDGVSSVNIALYDLTSGAGYRVADTPENENYPDISVGTDGMVRVSWMAGWVYDTPLSKVYVRTFPRPAADTTPPIISINAPLATTYTLNEVVNADYNCADEGGAGLADCTGPVPNGIPIDTATVGDKSFTVTAIDGVGNTASESVTYKVVYAICPLFDQKKAHKLGSTVPVKLQICDANGTNFSAAEIGVNATGLTKLDDSATGDLVDNGNSNPDNDFRYDTALSGYIYNLSTRGLSAGTWSLDFTVNGDPYPHSVQFDVR